MSDNLKKCLEELRLAMSYKDKPTRQAILKFLSNKDCVYNSLREISKNIINKNIKLSKSQKKRLNPHAKTIKGLACGVHKRKRKKLIQQSGGFLPWILPLVATAISALT